MNDCENDGDYCKFNTRFLALLKEIEAQEFFSTFETGEMEVSFDEEFGEIIKTPKIAEFFEISYMPDIILSEIRNVHDAAKVTDTKSNQLLANLEKIDFNAEFSVEEEDDEQGPGSEPLPQPEPGPGRRKRDASKFKERSNTRQKREMHGPPPMHGGPHEFFQEPVSYPNIIENSNRLATAVTKMLTNINKRRRKRQPTGGKKIHKIIQIIN